MGPKPNLKTLKRYNIFYGDNGTGKTTLFSLFAALPDGAHTDHRGVDYVIETTAGELVPGQKCSTGIRVFNAGYVQANIGRFDGPIRPILVVGKENRQLAVEVREDEAALAGRETSIEAEEKALATVRKDKDIAFPAIAKTIGEATSVTTPRNFRKPDAEKAFAKAATTARFHENYAAMRIAA
ncbi:AAA family ATPase, partial [Acetobacter sp. DsW_063]|uniref:AAA family ATPase n=1 Tax=Acetobacter sp. DsW_063 TaxID=1514894 RepID=UPI0013024FF5